MSDVIVFKGLPSSVLQYCQAVFNRKPLLAAENLGVPDLQFVAKQVRINPAHLRRYCDACSMTQPQYLPPAYLHVLAMPLHMRLFTHRLFPAKVLGLVHLRNVIRQLQPLARDALIDLHVRFNTLRETESGQEYDLLTSASVDGQPVWEEVSTMLARRQVVGKRPTIERDQRDESRLLCETTVGVAANAGRRYATVSGDYNPIHLFDRTAQWFGFKQCVAHGMWSLSRCLGLGAAYLPRFPYGIEAQFKLPVYLPSDFVFRAQRNIAHTDLSLCTVKGDRLHLSVQARSL